MNKSIIARLKPLSRLTYFINLPFDLIPHFALMS